MPDSPLRAAAVGDGQPPARPTVDAPAAAGDRVHLALAMLHLFTLPLATAPSAWTFAALMVIAAVRVPVVHRAFGSLLAVPVLWGLAAWAAWHAASMSWSADPGQGLDELGAMRMVLLVPGLWPLIGPTGSFERSHLRSSAESGLRPAPHDPRTLRQRASRGTERVVWLMSAALAGVFMQNLSQVLQHFEFIVAETDAAEGRDGGWLHPIQTGAWCAAAMCWQCAAAVCATGWRRWTSIAGLLAATGGLVLAGSRGPWLAAAVGVPLTIGWTAFRRAPARRAALVLALVGIAAAAVAWPLGGAQIRQRLQRASEELTEARVQGRIWTSTGLRIAMWSWAWDAFLERPLRGIGPGSFKTYCRRHPQYEAAAARRPDRVEFMARDHPHSVYLHVLACTGLPGGLLLALALAAAMIQCCRDPADHAFATGMLPALVTWLIGAQFECYQLNGHAFGLLVLVIALTVPGRGERDGGVEPTRPG